MDHEDEGYHGPDGFTREQRQQLIEMLEAHRAATLIWTRIGVWAKWFTSVGAAVVVLKSAITGLGIKISFPWWR